MLAIDDSTEDEIAQQPMRYMRCSECGKPFMLRWNDDGMLKDGTWIHYPDTLRIRACPSGGIYGVSIECPHCNYEEDL